MFQSHFVVAFVGTTYIVDESVGAVNICVRPFLAIGMPLGSFVSPHEKSLICESESSLSKQPSASQEGVKLLIFVPN